MKAKNIFLVLIKLVVLVIFLLILSDWENFKAGLFGT